MLTLWITVVKYRRDFMGDLEQDAKIVLQAVADRDMDGYLLTKKTGLDVDSLEKAVRLLTAKGLLNVKGDITGQRLLESWFQAVPGALRQAQLL
jgi:hypothetical protein